VRPVSTVDLKLVAEAARILRRHKPTIWLYAIQAGENGPIKIGSTRSPAQRIKTLQTGNAETLRGIAAWRGYSFCEGQLHEEYAYARLRGEWFEPVPELVEMVLALGGDFEDWT
jgi:hypothetical protein